MEARWHARIRPEESARATRRFVPPMSAPRTKPSPGRAGWEAVPEGTSRGRGSSMKRYALVTGVQTCALPIRSEEHTSELQSPCNLVCRLLLGSEEHTSELHSPCNLVCRLLLENKNHTADLPSPSNH